MSKLRLFIQKLNFRQKTFMSFVFVSLIPILFLGAFSIYQAKEMSRTNQKRIIETNLQQLKYFFNQEVNELNNTFNNFLFDDNLGKFFEEPSDSLFEEYKLLRDYFDPTVEKLKASNLLIDKVSFYTVAGREFPRDNILPLTDDSPEYVTKALKKASTQWRIQGDKVFLASKISSAKNREVVALLEVKASSFFSILHEKENEEFNYLVEDNKDRATYSVENFQTKDKKISYTLSFTYLPWTMNIQMDENKRANQISSIKNLTFTLIITVIFLALVMSKYMVGRLIGSIDELKNKVSLLVQKDFNVNFKTDKKDELGELSSLLGKMEIQVKDLIEDVYQGTIDKQNSEYKALTNQINSHFLYNTLSLISWKAVMNGQEDISHIALNLSRYYRTTLNKGKSRTSLKNELDNVKAYLTLQDFLSPNRIKVYYDIAEETLDITVINLILQPLVENAIEHGFKNKKRHCLLKISTIINQNDELILRVYDNGEGMRKETINDIFSDLGKSYGLKNILQRLQFYFGGESSLRLVSQYGLGTVSVVTIPYKNYQKHRLINYAKKEPFAKESTPEG